MSPTSERDDAEFETTLAAWLREGGDFPNGDAADHVASVRQALLDRLESTRPARSFGEPTSIATASRRRRIAGGSLALAVAIGLAVALFVLRSGPQLSAMDRIAARLREVRSYSYQLHWKTTEVADAGKRSTTWSGDGPVYWQAPSALHEELKIVKRQDDLAAGTHTEEVLEHFLQIFPAGKMGLFIDQPQKTFSRLPYDPIGSVTYPWEPLRMIRENSGEITRDLGKKQIGETEARGYVIQLNHGHGPAVSEPVEVWVDAQTDLPLHLSFERKEADTTYATEVTDFRWNISLDAKLFEPRAPAGYVDITPPGDQKHLDQIADTLRLYAQLSGGHYPRASKFEANAVRDEMLSLAGFAKGEQATRKSDPKFQQIDRAAGGLTWIEKILRNRYHAGYEGTDVGPQDNGKVLLWWHTWGPERCRVFYGDLRTELLTLDQWQQLVARGDAPRTD